MRSMLYTATMDVQKKMLELLVSSMPKPPGPRPRRPPCPRMPRVELKRLVRVWCSEDGDVMLADVLSLIPCDVRAGDVMLSVDRNDANGYPHVSIIYEHCVANPRYDEQMHEYEERMASYVVEMARWQLLDETWQRRKKEYDAHVVDACRLLDDAFISLDDTVEAAL